MISDHILPPNLERAPEPDLVMEDLANCEAYSKMGERELLPVYHFNAACISALAPRKARILDLGSGSASFLSYLSMCRPDLQIQGIELSTTMIELGNKPLAERKQQDRVRLSYGNMCDLENFSEEKVDLISSVFPYTICQP